MICKISPDPSFPKRGKIKCLNKCAIANQKGVSIIAVVATMLILSVMGVTLVSLVITGSDISINQLRSQQALNIAQGGVEYGLYTTTRGGGSWGEFNFPPKTLGNGSFTLSTNTSIVGSGRRMTLDSTGTVIGPLAERRVRAVAQRAPTTMMVYAKANGDGTPYFRLWDGTSWGVEQAATPVPANIQYIVLKFARTRDEAVLGTLSSNGDIRVQVWNGSTWSFATTFLANIGTTNDAYRGFDIEYETNGDRAMVVYNNANNRNPAYRIWNGTVWTLPRTLDLDLLVNYPTSGAPFWIEMAPNPLSASNEIAMITLDANTDVYGVRWNGAVWSNMGMAATWDALAAIATRKVIDVAYEQLSGEAMFIWGSSTVRRQRYRTWNGAVLSIISNLDIADMGSIPNPGLANWVRLAPDPFSNSIMYGVQDDRRDLNTRFWNGGPLWDGAGPHPEHDANTENTDRNFDIAFETWPANSGRAWLLWGNGASVSRRQWTGAAWGGTTTVGDDTGTLRLLAHPVSGDLFALMYESTASWTDDIWEMHLTGGGAVWSAKFTAWGGPVVSPAYEKICIGAGRYMSTSISIVNWQEVY